MSGQARLCIRAFAVLAMALAGLGPTSLTAQTEPAPSAGADMPAGQGEQLQLPFITIDRDRLYAESLPGKASQARYDAESAELIAENRQLEASLEAEERELTKLRDTVSAEEFRTLAAAFDRKVEDLRTAQDGKSRALTRKLEEERQAFFEASVPVLGQLMVDLNAVAIVDRSAIILTFDKLDVTDLAIQRLDAAFQQSAPQDEPQSPAPNPTAP